MSMSVSVTRERGDGFGKYPLLVQEKLKRAIGNGAAAIQAAAVASIARGSKTGHVYHHGNITHRASAPGEAPATDTGELVASIGVRKDPDGLVAIIEAKSRYAFWLEFGTINMEPRPFLGPAFRACEDKIRVNVAKALAFGGGGGGE